MGFSALRIAELIADGPQIIMSLGFFPYITGVLQGFLEITPGFFLAPESGHAYTKGIPGECVARVSQQSQFVFLDRSENVTLAVAAISADSDGLGIEGSNPGLGKKPRVFQSLQNAFHHFPAPEMQERPEGSPTAACTPSPASALSKALYVSSSSSPPPGWQKTRPFMP